ncbi:MBL fold metallo-hydrolase [Tepidimonas charontis]|uniref:Hydroxyacylglutathione hydrolase GloC n=1 Tax=Tepidimonas charontis TaxID=2267262 RepID=A0A554XD37_9BURK|nr:MBL fold metallo-hydrolase [Tepidimonas charontis]TSE33674.1 Hydroxyacylglutathione hydrolase GloC [Tepidimonas charontis]
MNPLATALATLHLRVFERGWLSANNILFDGPQGTALVDSGYVTHAAQTLALVGHALGARPLQRLLNTHLHSDHCGGNAALQAHYPELVTLIPPGQAEAVRTWDENRLSYRATGQCCARFRADALLQPDNAVALGGCWWQIHAAPGHDPDAVLLFEPQARVLIAGDALWQHGFGVVFPELDGEPGFAAVGATLDLIERLAPRLVIPGHGAPFGDPAHTDAHRPAAPVAAALAVARQRLAAFVAEPARHRQHALKVLLKFKLLQWQRQTLTHVFAWAHGVPYLVRLHAQYGAGQPFDAWLQALIDALCTSGAARREGDWLIDGG